MTISRGLDAHSSPPWSRVYAGETRTEVAVSIGKTAADDDTIDLSRGIAVRLTQTDIDSKHRAVNINAIVRESWFGEIPV
jgi:hypothetical protein